MAKQTFDYIFHTAMCEVYHMVKQHPKYGDVAKSDTDIADFAFETAERITAAWEHAHDEGDFPYPDEYDCLGKIGIPAIEKFYSDN